MNHLNDRSELALFFDYRLELRSAEGIMYHALSTDNASVVSTLNAHSFNVSLIDDQFKAALLASDYLVADGVGVVWACKLMGVSGVTKISGADLFDAAMRIADEKGMKVGFLGSVPEVLSKIRNQASVDYPRVKVEVLSPPYQDSFTECEAAGLLKELGAVDILFVGMTAPKQEKFVYQASSYLTPRVTLSIGAVFDFYAGTSKRAHPLFVRYGLEWLGRSLADPKRLGRRNLVAIPKFVFNCIRKSAFP